MIVMVLILIVMMKSGRVNNNNCQPPKTTIHKPLGRPIGSTPSPSPQRWEKGVWLAPDGNSVLYCTSSVSTICLFQRDCAAPLQEVPTKATANRQKKNLGCHCLTLCLYQQWEDGGEDADLVFYSVSATVNLASCVNATVQ
jgi:hypothetical protein